VGHPRFSRNPKHVSPANPTATGPTDAPPDDEAAEGIAALHADLRAMQDLVADGATSSPA
jgi:pyocin large subunit-like protein